MRKIVVLVLVLALLSMRRKRLDQYDRDHAYGAHADVKPVRKT